MAIPQDNDTLLLNLGLLPVPFGDVVYNAGVAHTIQDNNLFSVDSSRFYDRLMTSDEVVDQLNTYLCAAATHAYQLWLGGHGLSTNE